MNWTKTYPSEPGWYWYSYDLEMCPPCMVEVVLMRTVQGDALLRLSPRDPTMPRFVQDCNGYWQGPLIPEE